jgi:aminoglycoside 3-N-acetyltransferase
MKAILEYFPRIEAIVRNLYWRMPVLQWVAARLVKGIAVPTTVPTMRCGFAIDELISTLKMMGISENDVVIVHSSMKKLSNCGLGPRGIIESFMRQLCPGGTLVCPTFPHYADEPRGKERITKDMSNVELVYNVQKTRPWTGDLGRTLMGIPGARRSLHPLNTVAAYGASIDRIFSNETIDTLDLPCGPNSTWAAMAALNSKIVMLGVDMTHSLTMIHVAEDCHEAAWPARDWYRKRIFRVVNNNEESRVEVRERHPRWALSYAERKLSKDLYDAGIAKRAQVGSLDITVLDSKSLLDFLDSRKQSGYPYYLKWLSRL